MNSMESNAVCTNCGAPIVPEQLFCMKCGVPVNRGEANSTHMDEANNEGNNETSNNDQGQEFNVMDDTYQNQAPNLMGYTYQNQDPNAMGYTYQNQDPNAMGYTYQNQDPNAMENTYQYQDPNAMEYTYQNQDPNAMGYTYQNQDSNVTNDTYQNQEPNAMYYSNQNPNQNQNQNQNPSGMYPPYQQTINPSKPPLTPKQKKKRNIIIAAASAGSILVVSLAIFLFVYFSYTRLDCKNMYVVSYEGVNGRGRVNFSLDMSSKEYDKLGESITKHYLVYGITFEVDKKDGLSNGDKITVKANYNEEFFKKNKLKLQNTEFTYTVEGLIDATTIDLFEGLKITYDGFEGNATPVFDTSDCDSFVQLYVEFKIKEEVSGLKAGDEITVVASVDESNLVSNGYKTDTMEKKYTVPELQKISEYDVFQDIELKFEGASPFLSVDIDSSGVKSEIRPYVRFSLDQETNLKNGDVITITASIDQEDLLELGYQIKETVKQITVEGKEEYMITMKKEEAIAPDAALLSYLDREFSTYGDGYVFDQSIETIFGEGYVYKDGAKEIVKRYFLYNEEENPVNSYMVIVKYTITVVNLANEETSKEFYVWTNVSNLIMSEDTLDYIEPSEYLIDESQEYFEQSIALLGYEVTNVEAAE